jgi:hypothetical protein
MGLSTRQNGLRGLGVPKSLLNVFGGRVAEMVEKMRKRSAQRRQRKPNPRNVKALKNQGFDVSNMAEAMGFELMDLLQSTG